MMSLGMATEAQFAQMIEDMDADMTVISVSELHWRQAPGGQWEMIDNVPSLDMDAITSFENIPGVIVASPMVNGAMFMRSGPYAAQVHWNVIGIRPAALELMGLGLEYGRFLEEGDEFAAVFGALAETHFYVPGAGWEEERANNLWQLNTDEIEPLVDIINDTIQMSYDHRIAPPSWDWRDMWDDDMDEDMFDIEEVFRPLTVFELDVVGVFESTGNVWDDLRIFVDIDMLEELSWLMAQSQRDESQEWGIFSPIPGERERTSFDSAFVRVGSIDYTHQVAEELQSMGFFADYPGEWINTQRRQQQSIRTLLQPLRP